MKVERKKRLVAKTDLLVFRNGGEDIWEIFFLIHQDNII